MFSYTLKSECSAKDNHFGQNRKSRFRLQNISISSGQIWSLKKKASAKKNNTSTSRGDLNLEIAVYADELEEKKMSKFVLCCEHREQDANMTAYIIQTESCMI